jgi:type IV pilus assembly protein PilC
MATAAASAGKLKIKELHFLWEGKDRTGKTVKGEMRAAGDHVVNATLRRQGASGPPAAARSGKRTSPCSPARWRP